MKFNAWKLNLDKFRVEITCNLVTRVKKNTVQIYLEKYRIFHSLNLCNQKACLQDSLQLKQNV